MVVISCLVEPSTRPSDRVMGIRQGDLLFVIGGDTEEGRGNRQFLLAKACPALEWSYPRNLKNVLTWLDLKDAVLESINK